MAEDSAPVRERPTVSSLASKGPFQPIDNQQLPVRNSSKDGRVSPTGSKDSEPPKDSKAVKDSKTTVSVKSLERQGSKELKPTSTKDLPNLSGLPRVQTLDIEHRFLGEGGEYVGPGQPFKTIRSVVKAITVSITTFKKGLQGELVYHDLKLGDVTRMSFADNPEYPIHLRPFKGVEKPMTREGNNWFVLEWKKPNMIPADLIMKCSVVFGDVQLDVPPFSLRVSNIGRRSASCAVQ
jgi:hypothetical protein